MKLVKSSLLTRCDEDFVANWRRKKLLGKLNKKRLGKRRWKYARSGIWFIVMANTELGQSLRQKGISNKLQTRQYLHFQFLAALAALCPPLSFINGCGLHNLFQHSASELWSNHTNSYQTIPNFWILTKFHNFDQISQFWQNFTILTKFHNFNQISQFLTNFTIFQKSIHFDKILKFGENSEIWSKFRNLVRFGMNLYGLVTILKLNVGRGYVIHNH